MAANVLVALYSDRLAHRRRLAAVVDFFEHALALPLAFHDRQHTGRLLRTLHTGSSNLFHLWLAFFRSHLSTLIALLVMVPLALWVNWKLALLMMVLMGTFTLFNTIVVRRTGQAQRSVEQLNQEISERAGDLFGNVMVVQSFARVLSRGRRPALARRAGAHRAVSGAARLGLGIGRQPRRQHAHGGGTVRARRAAARPRRDQRRRHRKLRRASRS